MQTIKQWRYNDSFKEVRGIKYGITHGIVCWNYLLGCPNNQHGEIETIEACAC